jgi:DHA1 family bicyclomycin/chloramphenicol resistance-like MFS transporter
VQWTDFWALREPSGSRAFNIRPANHYTQSAAFSLAGMPNAIVAIVLQCIVALLLVTFVLAGVQATGVYILIFLYLAGLGSLSPNTTAIAIGPFTHRAGTASALLGSMQMAAGAIGSSLVSFFHNGTAMPMAVLLLSASLGSLGLQFGYQVRSRRHRAPGGGNGQAHTL